MENQDQSQNGGESDANADGGAATENIEDTADTQSQGQGNSANAEGLGVKELPPELAEKEKELLRAFHKKTQGLAEKEKALTSDVERYKSDAQVLYNLGQEEWFKKAVADEKARRSGASREISDDEFEAVKSDKKAFQNFLSQRDRELVNSLKSEFKGEFEKLSKGQQEMLAEREFDSVAEKYGDDFIQANENNELSPYLEKNLSYEDAYLLHMQKQGKLAKKRGETSTNTTRQTVAIEKSGMPRARGGLTVKAKNLDEALDRAFDLARKGTKDYHFEK